MKIFYSTIFFLFFSMLTINAQDIFYVSDDIVVSTGSSEDGETIEAKNYIKNNTSKTVNLVWEKDLNIPEGWQVFICDNAGCYPHETFSSNFSIAAGDSSEIKVQFKPKGIVGSGSASVTFTDPEDDTIAGTASFEGDAWAVGLEDNITSTEQVFNTYPNPVRNTLNVELQNYNEVQELEVYNMVGQSVGRYFIDNPSEVQKLDVFDLEDGMYFISLLDANGQLVNTKRFSKIR